MLCTRCGTDVGEKSGLCPNCTAASGEHAGRGAAIGSITPVQKFVHLKPGQPDPRNSQKLQRREPAATTRATGETPQLSPAEQPGSIPLRSKASAPAAGSSNKKQVANYVIALGLLLLLIAAALTFREPGARQDERPTPIAVTVPELTPEPEPSGPLSTVPPIALLAHDGITSYYESASARFDAAKGVLEISFQFIQNPAGRPGVAVRKEALERTDPKLTLSLRFKKGTTKFDSDALEGYAVGFVLNEQSIRVAKTFSKRLSSFGEVSQFNGDLRPGGAIRGALRDRRSIEQAGVAMTVEWSLRFDLTIAQATTDTR